MPPPWKDLEKSEIDALSAKHGQLHRISSGEHFVYVRRPKRADFKEWTSQSTRDPNNRALHLENLVKRVLVHPDAPTFDTYLDDFPALGGPFGAEVLEIAGAGDTEKKAV